MPVCEYCQKDEESHLCPEFVNKLRRERDAAVLQIEELKKQAALEGEGIAFLRHDLQESNRLLLDCANALGLALTHGHPPSGPELRKKFESGWSIYRELSEQGLFRGKQADKFLKTLEKKERPLDCVCGRPAFEHGGCRNYRPNKPCPSTYTHSSLGKLKCEKDEAHLHRTGDVEHKNGEQIWMSL